MGIGNFQVSKRTAVIALVVAVVVIGGVGAYWTLRTPTPTQPSETAARAKGAEQAAAMEAWYKAHPPGSTPPTPAGKSN